MSLPLTSRWLSPLRAGDEVEVRSKEEILATLDGDGCFEAMPFMPEMLRYCGQRFRVRKSAHKTCDTIGFQGARQLDGTVHLEDLRCNGTAHGGCQAGCLLFWKIEWLKKVNHKGLDKVARPAQIRDEGSKYTLDEQGLADAAYVTSPTSDDVIYRCQATELNRASEELPWWDFRQYVKDVYTRNIPISSLFKALGFWAFTKLLRVGAYRALIGAYDALQGRRGGSPFPFKEGRCTGATPRRTLDLKPGELVRVKSHEEILETVNRRRRNRGLSFDEEMVGFCGHPFHVLKRVQRIIDERTGRMSEMNSDCIILDGVTCQSRFKNKRLFCPRGIYPYWREIWLERVDAKGEPSDLS